MMSRKTQVAAAAFVSVHCCLLFAGFVAPYSATKQNRDFAYAPPTRLHLIDGSGHAHIRPFVYRMTSSEVDAFRYTEDTSLRYPVKFFVRDEDGLHLFTVSTSANLFVFGNDPFRRDIFSRVLFGGRISLAAAALATMFSLAIGTALGSIAGHFRNADAWIMRAAELSLAIPWIYLLLAVRAFLPLHIGAGESFFLISSVVGIIGWARPARLVRGVVLSAKERPFVTAARGFGASEWYLLRRHVLPYTAGVVLTQAVVLMPQFVTAEATLSYLGLGMGEPLPSWGGMLSAFQQLQVISSYWWMAAPIVALVGLCTMYFSLADTIHDRLSYLKKGQSYA